MNTTKREYPTYDHECEELVNRLNRHLRRLRALDPSEREMEQGSMSRAYTTDLAYFIDQIQRGPVFLAPQVIRRANLLVDSLASYVTKREQTS